MKTISLTLAMVTFLTIVTFAQESNKKFGFEFSSGISLATKKIGGAKLDNGWGYEGTFHYRFMPRLGVYGGWGWNRFTSDNSFAGADVCIEETGYVLGINFSHPIVGSKLTYYLRAGALYNHIETENTDGEIVNDSKHGIGFQLAGGLDINLGSNWSLTPGVKFNRVSRETKFEGVATQLDHQYLSARIGIMKRF